MSFIYKFATVKIRIGARRTQTSVYAYTVFMPTAAGLFPGPIPLRENDRLSIAFINIFLDTFLASLFDQEKLF
jgi:hypothetical protein